MGSQSLYLNGGNDALLVPGSPDINTKFDSKSVALWFHADDYDAAGRQFIYQPGGTKRGMNIYLQDGVIHTGAWNDNASWSGTWLGSSVVPNAWNHVAVTLDSANNESALRVNGGTPVTGFAAAMAGHNPATLGSVRNGTRFANGSGFQNSSGLNVFRGSIDDVKIYNGKLSTAAIGDLAAEVPAPVTDIDSDLVAFWDFEGSVSDQAVDGVFANNATLSGAAIVRGGLGASSLQFAGGTDIMELASSSDINSFFRRKSVALWFNPSDLSASGRQVIYQQGGGVRGMNIYLANGQIHARAWNNSVWTGSWLSSNAITQNAWNHVVLTFDSVANEIALVVNGGGTLVGFADEMNGHNAATFGGSKQGTRFANAASGFEISNARNSFVGHIDDARIYNRVLSADDILRLASETPSLP